MFGFLRRSSPSVPDYTALFDFDEARLAAGTGSELLDAFLRVPAGERRYYSEVSARPETAAILAADPAARGDVFARLCALAYGRDGESARARAEVLPENYESLKQLRFILRNANMSLPSAAALKFIKPARGSQRAGVRLALESAASALSDEALIFVDMALRANEPKRDPAFDRVLRQSLADFALDFGQYGASAFPAALISARACLETLGEDAESYPPTRAFAQVKEAASAVLARWRQDLSPELWRYLATCANLPEAKEFNEPELFAALIESAPPVRGALAERLHALNAELNRKIPGLPWTLERGMDWYSDLAKFRWLVVNSKVFRELPRTLLEKRCDFSPDFALRLVQSPSWTDWSDSVAFARSLAAALPRTPQAREAIEQRFAKASHYSAAQARALEKQKTILLDAFADAQAPQSLESRAAEARAAFEAAFADAREKAAKARAEATKDASSRQTSAILVLMRAMSRNRAQTEQRLGGADGPFKLLAMMVAAAKLGPIPAQWVDFLCEIEDDTVASRRESGLPAERDAPEFATGAQPLPQEFVALDAARAALALLAPLTSPQREAWLVAEDLAAHAPAGATPSGKWAKAAQTLARSPEAAAVRKLQLGCMAGPEFLYTDGVVSILSHTPPLRRALIWLLAFHPSAQVAKPLGELALRALAPSPRGGLTNELVGNACLWSLSELADGGGLSTLARIGARTRYPKVRQRINALFEDAARKAGRVRAEVEEEIAPHHGFDVEGVSRFALAGEAGAAEFRLGARGRCEIVWRNEAGKTLKAPSAAMKLADAAGLKAAKEAAREIETDYGVQAKRVEKLYRSTRALDFARWREFYVEHPFVGLIARRLIWRADDVVGLWRDGGFEDVAGARHDVTSAKLTLWHPIEAAEAEIAAWRDRLQALEIDQPFRQAWRETYRVTDAERSTGHYSNRFAGHIVRQHQFMTLARLNDWSCRHRMWQDVANDEPTYVVFPEHGIYAEYWTAGFGGDDPPVAESTAFLYLTTDRVVFHRLNLEAAPNRPITLRGARLRVDEVPRIVFSEILRGCDLFVSVASIARDAQWLDRGGDARHPNGWRDHADAYWRNASSEPLGANAQVRRELLARLLPALGAGERLKLDDRRLHVQGVRGAYAIHLGSGAAFHASGQHICIVPDGAPKKLVLPYEGDDTLALIVSKAMLLLRDDKIADSVILRQL